MSEAYKGGCACRAVRYEIAAEPVFMNHCQCLDCQHRSGTGHGSYLSFMGQQSVKLTGKAIVPANDMLAATWDQQGFVMYSSALKSLAIKLSKISGDLILLTSGPRAGLSEINLPAIQPGSSIMPGKVNPVVPEVVGIVAYRVIANDVAVSLAAHSGQLQLNAYEPLNGLAPI